MPELVNLVGRRTYSQRSVLACIMPTEPDEERDATPIQPLRDGISRFSSGSKSKYFSPKQTKPLPVLNLEGESADLGLDGAGEPQASGSRRRTSKKRNISRVSGSSRPPSKKKISRPYAPPETYAHLARLPDYLRDNLDGEPRLYSRELILMNVLCSRILWHKVSRASHVSVTARQHRPAQP